MTARNTAATLSAIATPRLVGWTGHRSIHAEVLLSGKSLGKPTKKLAPAALEKLQSYGWPGNVRELRNSIERMVILSRGDTIELSEIQLESTGGRKPQDDLMAHETFQAFKDEAEKRFLLAKLAENDGNVSRTARALEMQRSNLYKKIEKYGMDKRTTD